MERTMLTQAAKRLFYAAADTNQHRMSPPLPVANKRSKFAEPRVGSGQVSFRMLCHASRVGGIIGKSGSTIKQLQQETMTKIRIDEAPAEVVDRVIVVTGSASVRASMLLVRRLTEGNWGGGVEASAAQEALLRVFEKVLEVAADNDGVFIGPGRFVSCRLLAEASQTIMLVGRGGRVVEKIRAETGCRIRVSSAEKLQPWAEPTDDMVEIEGEVLAVKRALIAVSGCLQEHEFVERNGEMESGFLDNHLESLPERHLIHQQGSSLPQRHFIHQQESSLPERQLIHQQGSSLPERNLFHQKGNLLPERHLTLQQGSSLPEQHLFHQKGSSLPERHLTLQQGSSLPEQHLFHQRGSSLPERRLILPQGSSLLPDSSSSVNHVFDGLVSPMDSLRLPTQDVERLEEVSFRILCSIDKVGWVIGKGGSIIKALQSESGATISVGAVVDDCDDRVITVKAMENVESPYSQAQKALGLVFNKFGEASAEKGGEPDAKRATFSVARLVVPANQIGCLLGKGGVVISEMRKTTRTSIHILKTTEVPKCASDNDQVVQITGEFVKVQDAIYHVTGRLRDNLFPRKPLNYAGTRSVFSNVTEINLHDRVRDSAPMGLLSSDVVPHSLTKHSNQFTDIYEFSPELKRYPSPRAWKSQTISGPNVKGLLDFGGVSSVRRGVDLDSGSMAAVVTNTTIEIKIPERLIGAVYGENGSNLARLRQISGARVILRDPNPGTRETTMVISGTPDETQAAQSLIQAFILTGSS